MDPIDKELKTILDFCYIIEDGKSLLLNNVDKTLLGAAKYWVG